MISHKHKCIFVHIPKVAGTTIKSLVGLKHHQLYKTRNPKTAKHYKWKHKNLMVLDPSHLTSKQIYQIEELFTWKSYFKFAFVRNPWDQRVSHYNYNLQGSKAQKNRCKNGFKNYILENGIEIKSPHINQLDYITDVDGKLLVDYIGRYERLEHDLKYVINKLGFSCQKLPHKNKSEHRHYSEYYDEETKQIVAEKYAKDIEYFGYKFGE